MSNFLHTYFNTYRVVSDLATTRTNLLSFYFSLTPSLLLSLFFSNLSLYVTTPNYPPPQIDDDIDPASTSFRNIPFCMIGPSAEGFLPTGYKTGH